MHRDDIVFLMVRTWSARPAIDEGGGRTSTSPNADSSLDTTVSKTTPLLTGPAACGSDGTTMTYRAWRKDASRVRFCSAGIGQLGFRSLFGGL